ncbi:MAG: redoxin domain-containing protein [Armatimonadetes bacterium]|nr:redoxin domain-containing protein [Armatimonadota bacterium]
MMRLRLVMLTTTLGLLLTGCGERSAAQVYGALRERYAGAQSLDSTAKLTLDNGRDEPLQITIETTLQRPNKLYSRSTEPRDDDVVAASDGQVVRQLVKHQGQAAVVEAPALTELAGLLNGEGPVLAGAFNGLPVVNELTLFAGTAPQTEDLKLTIGDEQVQVGSEPCDVVTVQSPEAPTHELFVGARDGLLHRVRTKVGNPQSGQQLTVTWETAKLALDQPAPAGRFALPAPKGAAVVRGQSISGAIDALVFGIGKPAPAFTLKTLKGDQTVTLKSLRGKPVVIDFWATWCGPCERQQPTLQKLYQEYADRVAFYMVSNEESDTVAPVVAERKLTIPQLLDPESKAAKAFEAESLPTTFFIDAQGVLRQVHVGVPSTGDLEATYRADLEALLQAPSETAAADPQQQ